MLSEKEKHDLFTPLAKMKTTLSLMDGASLEEIQHLYLKILRESLSELEAKISDFEIKNNL